MYSIHCVYLNCVEEVGRGLFPVSLPLKLKFMIGLTGHLMNKLFWKQIKMRNVEQNTEHNKLIPIESQPVDHRVKFCLMNSESLDISQTFSMSI